MSGIDEERKGKAKRAGNCSEMEHGGEETKRKSCAKHSLNCQEGGVWQGGRSHSCQFRSLDGDCHDDMLHENRLFRDTRRNTCEVLPFSYSSYPLFCDTSELDSCQRTDAPRAVLAENCRH